MPERTMTPRASQQEPRRAEALWGRPSTERAAPVSREIKITRWSPHRNPAGTMLGYFDPQLPSGMIVSGCKLMVGPHGKHWIAMPGKQQLNKDGTPRFDAAGKQIWSHTIDFVDKATRDRFGAQVIAALRRDYPEAFADGAAP